MKMAETDSVVREYGVQTKSNFSIDASAKAFEILSSSMYKDKVKAIIRELSTNAVDAHIDAGTLDKQFVVKLPTQADPTFNIRDFGTGMSQQKMETLYTTYFGSDKNNSNDFVGCLGLGSKSPFSYVKTFSVTSYHQGQKMVYIANVGRDGKPCFNLMHKESTLEPNGLEVGFAVALSDIATFHNKAREVYRYFKYRPTLVGATWAFEEVNYILKGNGWGVSGNGQSYATMGHIAYPIDVQHFHVNRATPGNVHPNAPARYHNQYGQAINHYVGLLQTGLHIDFNIGDLEMTPSREDLQYNNHTIDAIKTQLDRIITEVTDLVADKFKNCKNLWEARCLYTELMGRELYQIREIANLGTVKYQGEDLKTAVGVGGTLTPGATVFSFYYGGYGNRVSRDEDVRQIGCEPQLFYEQDIERGSYVAARRVAVDGGNRKRVYLVKFDDQKAKDNFYKVMGFDASYLKLISSVPKPPRVKGRTRNEKVFVLNPKANDRYSNSYWTKEDIDIDDGGVYVEINRYDCRKTNGTVVSVQQLSQIYNNMVDLGIALEPVVGIKSVVVEKFKEYEDAEWVNVFDYLESKLKQHIQKNSLDKVAAQIAAFNEFREAETYLSVLKYSKVALQHPNKEFGQFCTKLQDLKDVVAKKGKSTQKVLDTAASLGYNLAMAQKDDLETDQAAVHKKYHVFELVSYWDVAKDDGYATNVMNVVNKFDS